MKILRQCLIISIQNTQKYGLFEADVCRRHPDITHAQATRVCGITMFGVVSESELCFQLQSMTK